MIALPADIVLPLDKPSGPTSHDMVARTRRALGTKRVGHTGTLDPFASGLLLLCVGRATRVAEYLSALDKTYEATVRLGRTTDTLDREGRVISEQEGSTTLRRDEILDALEGFTGDIEQVPPQYSAKKVEGEAMHRRARRGEHVELEPRNVRIHEVTLLSMDLPLLRLRVRCSSGTYIRSLARDVGEVLRVGAHLAELRRTAIGAFHVADALSADALDDLARVAAAALSPLAALGHMPSVEVGDEAVERLGQGRPIAVDPAHSGSAWTRGPDPAVVLARAGEIVAIAEARGGLLHPRKVFHR